MAKLRKFESPRDLALFANRVEESFASLAASNDALRSKINEAIAALNASKSSAAGERLGSWPGVSPLS